MKNLFMAILVVLFSAFLFASYSQAASLAWNASTGRVDNYHAYWTEIGTTIERHKMLPGDVTTWSLEGLDGAHLEPGKSYVFTVSASNIVGESGRSNSVEYGRPVYVPPPDNIPPMTINIPGPVTSVVININQ